MTSFEQYGKEIVALLVPLVTWVLNSFFRAKAKLLLTNPHTFTFLVQQPLLNAQGQQIQPAQTVHTRSFMVRNEGRETATKLEWVFNFKPLCINIWPVRHYIPHEEPDGRYVMIFDSLAPYENLGCELLSLNVDLPVLLTVRCDQCTSQNVVTYPQRIVPNWQRRLLKMLLLAGLAAVVYVAIVVIQFLVLRTPL